MAHFFNFNIFKGIALEISVIKNVNEKQFTWSLVLLLCRFKLSSVTRTSSRKEVVLSSFDKRNNNLILFVCSLT